MNKLKIGDVVKLKSGSRLMTVRCEDPSSNLKVICNWDLNGVIKEKSFFENQLEIVDNLKYLDDILKSIKG